MEKFKIMLIFGICLACLAITIKAATHSITFTATSTTLSYDNRPYLTNLRLIGKYECGNIHGKSQYITKETSKHATYINLVLKASDSDYKSYSAEMTVFSNGSHVLFDKKYYK